MKITIEPTDELYESPIDGKPMCRIWKGTTDKGTAIKAYVFSIVPADRGKTLEFEIPQFMKRSRVKFRNS